MEFNLINKIITIQEYYMIVIANVINDIGYTKLITFLNFCSVEPIFKNSLSDFSNEFIIESIMNSNNDNLFKINTPPICYHLVDIDSSFVILNTPSQSDIETQYAKILLNKKK